MPQRQKEMSGPKVPFFTSLWRSQATSLTSSSTDFVVFLIALHLLHIYYPVAAALGAVCGAIVSFYMGRNWAFKSQDGNLTTQAIKYAVTSGLSLLLNVAGLMFLVEQFGWDETLSKVIVSIIIGICVNFPMFRYWVFSK